MRMLVVEDELVSRLVLTGNLSQFGTCDVATDGLEAVSAVKLALETKRHYELICLDIMMPNLDGQKALQQIRELEHHHGLGSGRGAKIIMTTALSDLKNVTQAYKEECDGYLVKPIEKTVLLDELKSLSLI